MAIGLSISILKGYVNKLGPVKCGLNLNHLAHNYYTSVCPGPFIIGTSVVKGLTQKFEDDSLALNEVLCLFA